MFRHSQSSLRSCWRGRSVSRWPAVNEAPDSRAAAQAGSAASTPAAGASLGSGRTATPKPTIDMAKIAERGSEEGLRLHRRARRRARREPAEVDSAAEHLEPRRRHSRIGRDGEGLLRAARMPGVARLRRRHHRVGRAGQPGRLREVRRRRAEQTIAIYWQYDTMPVTQPDAWMAPPFEGRLVEQAPFKKVLIGRGADQLQGAADGRSGTR